MRQASNAKFLRRAAAGAYSAQRRGVVGGGNPRLAIIVVVLVAWLPLLNGAEFTASEKRLSLSPNSSALEANSQIRVLSWNVKAGALFTPTSRGPVGEELGGRVGRFGRMFRAIRPDILCLQEIWPRRPQDEVLKLLNRELPLAEGEDWNLFRAVDVLIASRFPLEQTEGGRVIHHPLPEMPDFHYGQAMALVDLPDDRFSSDVFVLTTHFRSRSGIENIRKRQLHAGVIYDRIMALKRSGHEVSLPRGTPMVITGDFNVYESNREDPKEHLEILRRGRKLQSDDPQSRRNLPDWDQTELKDLRPSINGRGKEFYTWRNDTGPYPPGALDRILFTDSVLRVADAFVLDPMSLSQETREDFGLESTDGVLGGRRGVYDHLPMIVDFVIQAAAEE